MRRVWIVLFGSVVILGFTGCGENGDPAASMSSEIVESTVADPAEQFLGGWSLVRIERKGPDGELVTPPSEDRIGYLIYGPSGHMGVTIMPPERERYAGDEPTADEALAALSTYTSYFGTFTVNAAEGFVTHHLEGSLNPRGAGSNYQRFYRFSENSLTLQPPVGEDGVKAELTWERLPVLPEANLTETHRNLFGFYRIESVSRQIVDGDPIPVDQYDTAFIIYAPSGHMSVHLMRPGRQPYADARPTPQEALQAIGTYSSYFGPFSVHEDDGYLVHHRIGHVNPGSSGSDAQRFYELTDTHLTLRPPARTDDQGRMAQSALRWARLYN